MSTPRSPLPPPEEEEESLETSAAAAAEKKPRNTSQDLPNQPTQSASLSDEEEPDIEMSSFMSFDPNFNRETPDSQSMEKALNALKTYMFDYERMKQFKPTMLVFLHSLLARKEARWYKPLNIVMFDWIADDWRKSNFSPKLAKRAAYALYSTFLHWDGPLSLQACLQSLDPELGLPRLELADSLRGLADLFARQPSDAQVERVGARLRELQVRLAPLFDALVHSVSQEVLTKRRDGFVSDILPAIDSLREDLSEDKQQLFVCKSRTIMLAHLQFLAEASFGGGVEAGCLATVLDHVFHLRPDPTPPDWPLAGMLNCPHEKLPGIFAAEKRGPHLLRLVELDQIQACSGCGRLLWGPGPQGYVCTVGDCEVMSHKACLDRVKPISCTTKLGLITRNLGGSRDSMPPSGQQKQQTASARATDQAASVPPPDIDGLSAGLQQLSLDIASPTDGSSGLPASDLAASAAEDAGFVGRRHSRSPSQQQQQQQPANGDAAAVGQPLADCSSSASVPDLLAQESKGIEDVAAAARRSSIAEPQPQPQQQQQQQPLDSVSGHPDIASVPVDFHGYIVDTDLNGRLTDLRATYEKDFDRLKEYQLALHEIVFSSMSHLRALTMLQLLFVQDWPPTCREVLTQLGLHFVPECIALYKSLLLCLRDADLQATGLLSRLGERLLAWYSEDDNIFEFKRLSLSFGFAKTATKRKTASINEDDIILRLISLRRDNQDFNRFFTRAETHPVMNKRRFVDLYSVNMQQTMRMVTLLDTAVKKAKKAKAACAFAAKDGEKLEACLTLAKEISDYSNNIGVKLKELSRQLVLSKSFANFWDKSMMDESQVHRFKNQISHLHTCRLHLTREVHMPGLENYRLRLLVFTEFLLVISESDEGRTTKYQLLKHLGPSMSVDSQQQQLQQQLLQHQQPQHQQHQHQQSHQSQAPPTSSSSLSQQASTSSLASSSSSSAAAPQQQQQQESSSSMASLIAVSCPPIIPMESVVHIFDTDTENRRKLDGPPGGGGVGGIGGGFLSRAARCAEFRVIIEQKLDSSGRVKPLMLEFRVSQERPRLPFMPGEAASPASEFADCIRKLAPRLSGRLDRHSSMAGSSTDLQTGGRPGAAAAAAVAAAAVANSQAATAAAASAAASAAVSVATAATAAASERHRRANSHAGLAVARPPPPPPPPPPSVAITAATTVELPAADAAGSPSMPPPQSEAAAGAPANGDGEGEGNGDEAAAASSTDVAVATRRTQELFRRQQNLLAEQHRSLLALMRLQVEDCGSIAEETSTADECIVGSTGGLLSEQQEQQQQESLEDDSLLNNDVSSSSGVDAPPRSTSQTLPPGDSVVVERRAQIVRVVVGGGGGGSVSTASASVSTDAGSSRGDESSAGGGGGGGAAAESVDADGSISSGEDDCSEEEGNSEEEEETDTDGADENSSMAATRD